jgi:hypothetical protein
VKFIHNVIKKKWPKKERVLRKIKAESDKIRENKEEIKWSPN